MELFMRIDKKIRFQFLQDVDKRNCKKSIPYLSLFYQVSSLPFVCQNFPVFLIVKESIR